MALQKHPWGDDNKEQELERLNNWVLRLQGDIEVLGKRLALEQRRSQALKENNILLMEFLSRGREFPSPRKGTDIAKSEAAPAVNGKVVASAPSKPAPAKLHKSSSSRGKSPSRRSSSSRFLSCFAGHQRRPPRLEERCTQTDSEPLEDPISGAKLAEVRSWQSEAQQQADALEQRLIVLEQQRDSRRSSPSRQPYTNGTTGAEDESSQLREALLKTEQRQALEQGHRRQAEQRSSDLVERLNAKSAEAASMAKKAEEAIRRAGQLEAMHMADSAELARQHERLQEAGAYTEVLESRLKQTGGAQPTAARQPSASTTSSPKGARCAQPVVSEQAAVKAIQTGDLTALNEWLLQADDTVLANLLTTAEPGSGRSVMHLAVAADQDDLGVSLLDYVQLKQDRRRHLLVLGQDLLLQQSRRAFDSPDAEGKTPLLDLLMQPEPSDALAVRLLASRANLAHRDAQGMTPFLHCVQAGHRKLVELLLNASQGAALCDEDDTLRTPLHWAASAGHADVVQLLLQLQSDPASEDDAGYSPLRLAVEAGHTSAAAALARVVGGLQVAPTPIRVDPSSPAEPVAITPSNDSSDDGIMTEEEVAEFAKVGRLHAKLEELLRKQASGEGNFEEEVNALGAELERLLEEQSKIEEEGMPLNTAGSNRRTSSSSSVPGQTCQGSPHPPDQGPAPGEAVFWPPTSGMWQPWLASN